MPLAVDVPHGARLAAEGPRTHHGAGELLPQQLLQALGQTRPRGDQVLRAGHEPLVVARVEDEQRSVHRITVTAVSRVHTRMRGLGGITRLPMVSSAGAWRRLSLRLRDRAV